MTCTLCSDYKVGRYLCPTVSDHAELVEAVARGDRRALGLLYDAYAPQLLALGMRTTRDRVLAEDVLHDVFVEVWKAAWQYDPSRGSVLTWLGLRMRSRCIDRIRAPRRNRTGHLDETNHLTPVEASAGMEPDYTLMCEKLLTLPGEQREVLELGYFEGLSATEIATRVGIPVGTVKSRMRLGINKLRGLLDAVVES